MKIFRFEHGNEIVFGRGAGESVEILEASSITRTLDAAGSGETLPLASIRPLTPVDGGKIVAVGRNYADHARELGNEPPPEPIIFLKPPSSLLRPGGVIEMPAASARVDFEGELAVVIGSKARNVPEDSWRHFVFGFTCANDVTARDLQKRDVQFTRGKGFDTFLPLGPCIETDLDPSSLRIQTRLNDEVRQDGNTSQMIFSVGRIIAFISSVMTLEEGDVILTGTPSGVGPMSSGDSVEVEIEGIGVLRNEVR